MIIFASILAAVLPMVSYLVFLWQFDKYEREPITLILKNFFWGAFLATFSAIIISTLFQNTLSFLFNTKYSGLEFISIVLLAPFVEEITKSIYLLKMIKNINFDNLTDGIIYGAAIGLGFGMTENFLYFVTFGATLENFIYLVIVRSLFSAVMHAISTSVVGAFLSLSLFKKENFKYSLYFIGLIIAIAIHFLWNLSATVDGLIMYGAIGMSLIIVIFIFFIKYSVNLEKRIIIKNIVVDDFPDSTEYLLDEIDSGNIKNLNKNKRNLISLISKIAFAREMVKNKNNDALKLQEKIKISELKIKAINIYE